MVSLSQVFYEVVYIWYSPNVIESAGKINLSTKPFQVRTTYQAGYWQILYQMEINRVSHVTYFDIQSSFTQDVKVCA